jgi:hypothetical protein
VACVVFEIGVIVTTAGRPGPAGRNLETIQKPAAARSRQLRTAKMTSFVPEKFLSLAVIGVFSLCNMTFQLRARFPARSRPIK